jgi:cytidylate kinase
MIITIDGPSGTGKSTVAKGVAKKLGFTFFDTGAMYRSFAYLIIKEGKDPADQEIVNNLLPHFQYSIRAINDGERHYFVGDEDVTHCIRTQEIGMAASLIATYPKVREAMVKIQRDFGSNVDAVFEGRDMGTVVFPDADLKIFLTAKAEVRAERRYRELLHKFPDLSMTKEEILSEIEERDNADSTREISPLKQAKDAILIDTSTLSVHQVIDQIVRKKPKGPKAAKMKWFYRLIYSIARGFFKCCFRLKIEGLEHFRPGAAIIAANHTSFYDPPVLSISCPEEVHFLARDTLFTFPLFGRLIRALNAHPVARGASDVQTFKTIVEILSQGNKLILFPEGTRSANGELKPMERGVAFLMQKTKCRVIPAYIHGAFEAWPSTKKFPKLFGSMTVIFGAPIEWDEGTNKRLAQEEITKKIDQAIRELRKKLRPR